MCGSAPSAPQLPAYPGMTPGETNITGQQTSALNTQQNMLQGVSDQLGNNQNILHMISGLFNPDGSIKQEAVAQLQQMAGNQTSSASAAGAGAINQVPNITSAVGATSGAYQNALQGNIPQNQQLAFQQNQAFQQMQEQAAQQGIKITGTNFSNAVSDSSAGQKLIQNFQQNANIQNQNYALGYTQQLAGNMGQLTGAGATQANTGLTLNSYGLQQPLSFLQNSITNGPAALSPLLTAYQGNLSTAYAPQYQQQIGPYQQQMAQAQANYQGAMGQYNAGQSQLYGGLGVGLAALGGAANAYKAFTA